tara:strand:+ start:9788 stop:10153 length:366 start_codon:yes stop_codon:yes gene_type:complete
MAIITVSNNSNTAIGEILNIKESSQKLTKNESMKEWIASGGTFNSWKRLVSLVYVTDKTAMDLQYLLEPLIDYSVEPPVRKSNKYYFKSPDTGSELWNDLYLQGESHQPFSVVSQYIVENL